MRGDPEPAHPVSPTGPPRIPETVTASLDAAPGLQRRADGLLEKR